MPAPTLPVSINIRSNHNMLIWMRAINFLRTRTVKSLLRSFTIPSTGHFGRWIYAPLPLLGGEDDIVVSV